MAMSPESVEFLGQKSRHEVLGHMAQAAAVVVPSTAIETFGLVGIEAMSVGTPVLAFRPNTVALRVEEDGTGLAVSWGDDLTSALSHLEGERARFFYRCIDEFQEKYSESAWLRRRISLYTSLVSNSDPDVAAEG